MKTLKISLILLAFFSLLNNSVFSQQLTGLKIIENVYNRAVGDDMTADLTMTLTNSSNENRVREIKQFSKDFGDLEKKIMFFVSPADVKNTSFMSWSYDEAGKDDDQWIYLPALKKTKRISSDSKSDYFMGSDFTYDDLGDRQPDQDVHKLLREEKLNGEDCYVVESIPKDKDYMYSKTITWIIKDKWIGLKKEFYDEDEELLKILKVNKYEDINGFWIITNTEMKNEQKDHKTIMILKNVKINTGINDDKFTERIMTRGI
ncbi:MAG: outer membrane lipoprotein-sorting protein [Ignavibacteriae bacterium]|nr:outer membrane lipoprotein-sorting protein [Ignavibacteriota bacterium]MCB9247768.1 outer membrane lipoprotein-sorting protein [Ignavibacteriales bacterium]